MVNIKWKEAPVKDLVKIETGSRNTEDKNDDGQYPFFVRSQTVERIDSFHYDCEAVLTAGDGVGTGKVFHYINGKFDAHQRVYVMSQFKQEVLGKYFYYWFSKNFYAEVAKYTAKSSVDSVRRQMIAGMVISLPSAEEQEKIVGVLSDVDTLITDLQKLIRKKKDVLYGSMQKLMTGEIRLQGFSEEWELVEIGSVAKVIDPHPSHRAPEAVEYGIPFVGIGDIDEEGNINKKSARIVDESVYAEHSQRYDLSKNLIGIGRVASLGKVIRLRNDIGEYAISPTMAVIDFESIDPMFAYYYMRSSEFQNQFTSSSNGSTRQSVGMHYIRNLNIRKPSPEEQVELSQCLGDMDYEIGKLEEKCSKYQKVKQGMMEELLTGKVRLV